MKRLPQTGSAPRLGGMQGNQDALRGGAAGFMLDPSDPNTALVGGLLGSAVPYAKGRLLGRPDVQEYMKNQLIGRQGRIWIIAYARRKHTSKYVRIKYAVRTIRQDTD